MVEETLIQRGTTLVRRLLLEPGESTAWHVDPYHRVSVVVRGKALAIEYKDGGATGRVEVAAGEADWDRQVTGYTARSTSAERLMRR